VITLSLVSPRARSRLAGLLYLLATAALYSSQVLMGFLLEDDSITRTAANVLAHRTQYEWVFAVNLLGAAATVGAVALFYEVLRPVNERLSRLAALFGLVGCAIQGFLNVFLYGALALLDGTPYRDAFRPAEFQAIAHLCLIMFADGIFVACVFFGFYCIAIGYLTFKSTFLPRAIGAVVGCGGAAWLIGLVPRLMDQWTFWRFAIMAGVVGQLVLSLWLLAKGVNDDRWRLMTRLRSGNDEPREIQLRTNSPLVELLPDASENIIHRPKLVP
jgi:Domain of unknown function (DUF4386)